MVAGKDARLKLPYPIPTHHDRWDFSRFKFGFVAMLVEQAAETRGVATKIADKRKLRRYDVNDRTETGFLRKLQALLGFALHVGKRLTDRQKPVIQVMACIRRVGGIADAVGGIEHPMV